LASIRPEVTGRSGLSGDLLPDRLVAARYKVTTRTIDRWDQQPELGFPRALRINNRKYRRVNELARWERQRVAERKGDAA
jgi:hypothetical protein